MKEKPDTRTDPILEGMLPNKRGIPLLNINSMEELYDYAKANQKKWKALGFKYAPLPPSPKTKEEAHERET